MREGERESKKETEKRERVIRERHRKDREREKRKREVEVVEVCEQIRCQDAGTLIGSTCKY